jgi:SAM-dependent methyltransferase
LNDAISPPSSTIYEETLQRFDRHQRSWSQNASLRALYRYWYGEVKAALEPVASGKVVELGSGPGFAKLFLPDIYTSDIFKAEWHDYQIDATHVWPFADAELDGVVLFDVLHHLSEPLPVFHEATRTLRAGGRMVLMEPYISPCSYPVLHYLHPEDVDTTVDPFSGARFHTEAEQKDPFAGNQALAGLIFGQHRARLQAEFPELSIVRMQLYSGLSYVASGGFSRRSLLPSRLWSGLFWLDRHMPRSLLPILAFRFLVILERAGSESERLPGG